MLQLQQLGFTNRQLSESHHHCHVNRSEILAALSSGHHESGKKKGTSNNALRLTETGWIILNHVWLRRGGAVQRRKKRETSGCQLPLVIFHFFLTGALKVGYCCPTNPSPSHTTPETWAIFSHLVPFLR